MFTSITRISGLLCCLLLGACGSTNTHYAPSQWLSDVSLDRRSHFLLSSRAHIAINWQRPIYEPVQRIIDVRMKDVLEHHFQSVTTDDTNRAYVHYEFQLALWYWDDHINRWSIFDRGSDENLAKPQTVADSKAGAAAAAQSSSATRVRDIHTSKVRLLIRIIDPNTGRIFDSLWLESQAGLLGDKSLLNAVRGGELYESIESVIDRLVARA